MWVTHVKGLKEGRKPTDNFIVTTKVQQEETLNWTKNHTELQLQSETVVAIRLNSALVNMTSWKGPYAGTWTASTACWHSHRLHCFCLTQTKCKTRKGGPGVAAVHTHLLLCLSSCETRLFSLPVSVNLVFFLSLGTTSSNSCSNSMNTAQKALVLSVLMGSCKRSRLASSVRQGFPMLAAPCKETGLWFWKLKEGKKTLQIKENRERFLCASKDVTPLSTGFKCYFPPRFWENKNLCFIDIEKCGRCNGTH